jgi:hypothetical protein
MTTERNCTLCSDPNLCATHGLLQPITTMSGRTSRCLLEDDKPAALLYKALLRLAAEQGVDISELMDDTE